MTAARQRFLVSAAMGCLTALTPAGGQGQREGGTQQGHLTVEQGQRGRTVPVAPAEIKRPPGQPPTIVYGPSRSSSTWIERSPGSQVAVDEGIEWEGKIAYLSLTFDLLVVDAKTKKTLWWSSIGAFWDTITFENQAKPGEPAKWMLALRSSTRPDFVQLYDLETGKKGELKGEGATPEGKPFQPRKAWSGSAGVREEKLYRLVGTVAEWTKLSGELFGKNLPDLPAANDLDFTNEMLLVCYAGKAFNWRGIGVELAVENDERLLLRLNRHTYQSMGDVGHEYPYGVIILPRREGKPVVLEYNRQNLIGGPAIWKSFTTVTLPK